MNKIYLPVILLFTFFIFSFNPYKILPPEDEPKEDSTSQQTYTVDTISVPKYDSAYESKVITVVQLYWTSEFDFEEARKVLKDEGYTIKGWKETPPSVEDFDEALKLSNQLWIISDMERKFEPEHYELIKDFFEAGHGVYLMGDNADYYADVNYIGNVLVNATLYGEFDGEKKIKFPGSTKTDTTRINNNNRNNNQNNNNQNSNNQNNTKAEQQYGKLMEHDITVGLKHLYEGITVSGLSPKADKMTPVVYGSDNEVLISTYEENNKRLILDGGFTRLYNSWDAETTKYIENVVKWLANTPRFEGESTTVTAINSETEYSEQTIVDNEATPTD
jgi:hypothetical protein